MIQRGPQPHLSPEIVKEKIKIKLKGNIQMRTVGDRGQGYSDTLVALSEDRIKYSNNSVPASEDHGGGE